MTNETYITETMRNEYTKTGSITCPNCSIPNAITVRFDAVKIQNEFSCNECSYQIMEPRACLYSVSV